MDIDQELQKKTDKVVGEVEETTTTKPRPSISRSPSSSPSREFSFAISLHPSSGGSNNKTNSFAIDLSPADEIFFHGHLLPLHLISQLPISSDSSKSSLENFNLLMKDLSEDHKQQNDCTDDDNNDMMRSRCNTTTTNTTTTTDNIHNSKKGGKRGTFKIKLSSFLFTKWRKGSEAGERKDEKKNKVRLFEMSNVFKRYLKMVQPNLFSKGKRENCQLNGRSCSFTESLCLKEKQPWKARRGGLSAPATMQTSPTNSTGNLTTDSLFPSKSGTTMEELQSAIQAAIAHCKNSTAVKIETLNF